MALGCAGVVHDLDKKFILLIMKTRMNFVPLLYFFSSVLVETCVKMIPCTFMFESKILQ